MAMAEAEGRFGGTEHPPIDAEAERRAAEQRCLEAEQKCFVAERRRFEAERRREQVEALLAQAQRAGKRMEQMVIELKALIASLRRAGERPSGREPAGPSVEDSEKDEVVRALSVAVERLRARVEAVGETPQQPPAESVRQVLSAPPEPPRQTPVVKVELPKMVQAPMPAPLPAHPVHKHSMSWIARWRARRKQRR